jgi:periplasmic protein TonB
LLAYQVPSPADHPPFRQRASGLALALGVNLVLLLVLLGLGVRPPALRTASRGVVVDLIPESAPAPARQTRSNVAEKEQPRTETKPVPKPPPITLPAKPTIQPDPSVDMIEMSKDEYAAADIRNLPKSAVGAGGADDSEAVGRGPNGEVLYAAEWARHPTDAELDGYVPANAPDGWGLIACKTIAGNRVEDCIELDQYPRGSHLASAVRQAAWQFRVRPPRKNGRTMVGEWVQIRIDYIHVASSD